MIEIKYVYRVSSVLSSSAKDMIMLTLQGDPAKRPNIKQLLRHEFLCKGFCPASLPVSCLTMAPRFDNVDMSARASPHRGVLTALPGNSKYLTHFFVILHIQIYIYSTNFTTFG